MVLLHKLTALTRKSRSFVLNANQRIWKQDFVLINLSLTNLPIALLCVSVLIGTFILFQERNKNVN